MVGKYWARLAARLARAPRRGSPRPAGPTARSPAASRRSAAVSSVPSRISSVRVGDRRDRAVHPDQPPEVDLRVLQVGARLDELQLRVPVVHRRGQGVGARRGAEAQLLAGEPELLARAAQLGLGHRHQLGGREGGEERLLGGEGDGVLLLELGRLALVRRGAGAALVGAALEAGEEGRLSGEPVATRCTGRLGAGGRRAAGGGVDPHRRVAARAAARSARAGRRRAPAARCAWAVRTFWRAWTIAGEYWAAQAQGLLQRDAAAGPGRAGRRPRWAGADTAGGGAAARRGRGRRARGTRRRAGGV